jgi:hypothetical protein
MTGCPTTIQVDLFSGFVNVKSVTCFHTWYVLKISDLSKQPANAST